MGPNCQRPAVPVPQNFRAPDPLPPPQAASFADLKWFDVFQDPELQKLIRSALEHNYDLRRVPVYPGTGPFRHKSLEPGVVRKL